MENSNVGVKDTKELIVGGLKIAALLVSEFKDGVQASDFAEIVIKIQSSEPLKKAILEMYNGAGNVGNEVKNIDLAEALSMLPEILEGIKELIAAAKK